MQLNQLTYSGIMIFLRKKAKLNTYNWLNIVLAAALMLQFL